MAATPGRFEVEDGEIIDTKARQIISLDQLAKLATPEEQDSIRQQIQDSGWAGADQTESSDSPALARGTVSRPSVTNTPSQQDALPSRPSLQQFMEVAKQDNPDVPDKDLRRYWAQNYSDINPKTLPTLESFLPAAKEDNPGVSDQALKAYWEENYGDLGAAEKEAGDFGRGVSTAFKQIPQLGYGVAAGIGAAGESMLGEGGISTKLKEWGVAGYLEKSKEIYAQSKPSDDFTYSWDQAKQGNFGALVDWMQYGMGYMGAQGAQMLATAGAGSVAGRLAQGPVSSMAAGLVAKEAARLKATQSGATLAAEELAKVATANVASRIGQTTALAAAATGMEGGEIFGDLSAESVKSGQPLSGEQLAKAFGATLAAGSLEFVGDKLGIDLMLGKTLAGKMGGRAARMGTSAAAGAAVEGGTEVGQTLIEEYGKGRDAFSPEAMREAVNAGALGALGGTVYGGAGGIVARKDEPPASIPVESIPDQIGVGDPTVSIDQAIANAQDILSAPVSSTRPQEDALSSRLAQLATDTSAQREADRLESERQLRVEGAQSSPSTLPIAEPSRLWMDEAVVAGIEAGQAFTPRAEPEPDAAARIAEERAKLVAMQQRSKSPTSEESEISAANQNLTSADTPLQSAADLAYPPSERGRMLTQAELALRDRQASKRPSQQVPMIEGAESSQASTIVPGSTLAPRQEPELTAKERIASEREKLVRMKATRPAPMPSESTVPPSSPTPDAPLRSALDRAYPSVSELHDLARDKGFDVESPVFKTLTKMSTGKTHLDELSPSARDRFAETLKKLTPRETPTIVESPTKKALAPVQPGSPSSDAVTAPRSALPPEQNAEMLLRAEKANADLESSSEMQDTSLIDFLKSKGGLQDQGGELSTMEVDAQRKAFSKKLIQEKGLTLDQAAELAHEAGYIPERDIALLLDGIDKEVRGKGQHADWYRELTTGPKPMTREAIDSAVAKIIEDHGVDTGAAVERVKAALLNDGEFDGTQWGEDAASILRGDWPAWIEKPSAPSQPGPSASQQPVSASPPTEGTTTLRPSAEAATTTDAAAGRLDVKSAQPIDTSAHEAAPSPTNDRPEPTEAQRDAGNFKMGHLRIAGLDITIEHPEGSTRTGTNAQGEPWSVTMQSHYGYIRGTKGKDKEHIDVFVKPGTSGDYNGPVFVIDQEKPNGSFDEHKVVIGASSMDEAVQLYEANYSDDVDRIRSVKTFTMSEFKLWLKAGNHTKPAGTIADYKRERKPTPSSPITLESATLPHMATDRGPGSSSDAQIPPEPGREQSIIRSLFGSQAKIINGHVQLFHGSRLPISSNFNLSYVGKTRGYTEGWGIYFSADKSNARVFGRHVTIFQFPIQLADQLLDFDKPLSKQTEYVRSQALKLNEVRSRSEAEAFARQWVRKRREKLSIGFEERVPYDISERGENIGALIAWLDGKSTAQKYWKTYFYGDPDPSGYTFYRNLEESLGSQRKASKWLQDLGIIGASFNAGRDLHAKNHQSKNVIVWDQPTLNGDGVKEWLGDDALTELPNPSSPQQGGPDTRAASTPEPFSLTPKSLPATKAKTPTAEQLEIDVPSPTVGERPIIGREVTPEEEPLFSESAKQPDAEQTDLTDGLSAFDNQSPYEQRSNEPAARNRALAREALAAIDGAASVHDQRGDIPRSGIPRPARPEEERLAGLERAGIRTPAVAISKDLATKGRVDLRGYTVTSMSDLATISQVLRNPRVETLRFFYVKNRKIVGHEGITSRMPGAAVAFPISRNDLEGMTVNERVDKQEGLAKDMIDRMERLGADGYYMLHNHPSGVSRPSRADIQLTRLFDQVLPGLLGHVVIDSNEYSTIDASGNVATHQLPAQKDAILEPYRPHRLLAPIIKDPESLATVGKAMQTTDGYITIVYVSGGDGKTRAIQEIPKKLFLNVREATNFLRGQSRAFGAMDALAYADTNDTEVWRAARELQKTGSLLDFAGMLNGKPESLSRHDQYKDYDHSFGVPHRLIGGMRVSDNASAPPSSQRSTISIDGIERPTMNSNGAPIAKTEESIRNFWKWFGNSQAVDAQGRPVVVYHGTGKKFTTFSKKRSTQGILWFTSNRDAVESGDVGAQGRGHIMELYAKVDRPAGWREYDRLLLAQFKGERLDGAILKEKNGQFDGFVFEPSQLKSAIGNSGAFDPNDSSIVKDEGIPYGTGTDYVRNSPDAKPSGRKLGGLLNNAQRTATDDIALTYEDLNSPNFPGITTTPDPSPNVPSRSRVTKDLTDAQRAALARVHGTKETWAERLDTFKKTWKRELVQGLFDQYAPILDYSKKGYILSRMAKSGDGTLEALMLYGKPYVDSEGAYRVDYTESGGMQGFSKVLSSLQGEHDRFLEWVAAQRAGRLKSVGLENLYSEADISTLKTLNQGKMPDGASREAAYLKALSQLNEWNDAMVKIGVDSGLISDEAREQFKNVPYVPFYRLQEEGLVTGFGKKPGLVNQYAWKKLKGGTAHLNDDLLANLLQNWSHIITASAKNRAAKETLMAAKQAGVAEEIPSGAPGKGHVHYLENGKEVTFTVSDPALMDAVAALHYAGLGAIGKPFTAMKRALSFAVTVNPAYKIRNLIRDSIQAIGTSDLSYNPLKNMQQGAKATRHEAETRAQLLAGGGMMRFGSMLDGNDTTRTRRLIESGVDPETILSDAGAIEKVWKRLIQPAFQAYQEFGDRGEQLNRAALYEQLLKKGMTHQEASFWARDLMDFSMSGKWAGVRILTQVVPFLNARLQGLYKLGRATKQDYRKIATTLGAVALASIGLMLAYQDDEDWKKREDFDRENYWWFKVGNTAFRIPKPFEIGVVGTIAERSVEYLVSREMTGERFGERLAAVVFSQLSMNPTPQLVKPLMDLYANKDAFTGRPIETMGMERLRKEDRYTDRTSETAKFLGSLGLPDPAQLAMGRWNTLSPVQVDSLVRGYFSWLGSTTMTALDYGIRPMLNRGERPDMTLKEAFLVGNFAESLPNNSSRYMTQFYSQATEIEQAYNSYRDALKRGDSEGAASIMEDERDKLSQYHMVEHVKRQESKLNEQIKLIERSQRMSGEEKRARIDELQQRKQRLVERVNDRQLATR